MRSELRIEERSLLLKIIVTYRGILKAVWLADSKSIRAKSISVLSIGIRALFRYPTFRQRLQSKRLFIKESTCVY